MDPVEDYVSTLPTGEYFIIAIDDPGAAIESARSIVFQQCPGAEYQIFPIGQVGQSLGTTLVDRAVLVIGGLDSLTASSVSLGVKSTRGARVYRNSKK
jgi:hypothetical protein